MEIIEGVTIILLIIAAAAAIYYKIKYDRLTAFLLGSGIERYIEDGVIADGISQDIIIKINHILRVIGAEYSSEMLNRQIEYSALQSQINPHFLY
jgi:hypothetical protein